MQLPLESSAGQPHVATFEPARTFAESFLAGSFHKVRLCLFDEWITLGYHGIRNSIAQDTELFKCSAASVKQQEGSHQYSLIEIAYAPLQEYSSYLIFFSQKCFQDLCNNV